MIDLLRRAWDALDTFKQAYPENWHEEDEQVLNDLLKADLKMSGVKREWQGLTEEEYKAIRYGSDEDGDDYVDYELFDEGEYGMQINIYVDRFARAIEAKLKEKNT